MTAMVESMCVCGWVFDMMDGFIGHAVWLDSKWMMI